METAIRKPPWSVRSKKIISDPYPAPAPVPSQIKGWNPMSTNSGPSRLPADNHHPHFGETLNQSQRVRKSMPSSDRNLPAGFLTSPARSSSRHLSKGKGREHAEQTHASNSNMYFSNPIERPSQSFSGGLPLSPPSSPFAGNIENSSQKQVSTSINNEVDDNGVDFDMLDGTQADAKDAAPEEVEEAELLNWSIYLHQTILRHTASSSNLSTFHMLMQAMPLQSLPHSSVETYSSASARILDVLSIASTRDEWTYTVRTVCISMLQIAGLLVAVNSIPALTALFSLLTCLTCTIPSFSPVLVSIRKDESDEDSPAEIVSIFCTIVQNFFTLFKDTKAEIDPDVASLARENMDLFESLCWQLPSDLESCLTLIVRSPQVFTILLDASQPPWLLERSARLLVWLSARKSLFRVLLSFPEPEIPNGNMADFTKLPHIEALCSLLVDTSRGGPEITSMKESILTFFSMLSQSHLDALTILVESRTLVPSLVAYLTHSSTPLWEDDDLLRSSPSLASSTLRTINQTLFLLYMLIFGPEAAFNLRHKLQVTPSRQFNGITHMFIVTLGRLSYTDPPEWIAAKDKVELEHIAEMARELLDLVVEGPEGDSVWATYQEGPEQESEADDDEVEARRLDANEI
ncbi:hypothetical protein SERLA73DRAFT_179920 [Serpula lacrymans var. lacrymans S7.3]|uniref:Uncharacterized protein n=2 Tax=Serpula lacrymans var. lacrymans TaxID=341189 RepID=F8PUX9_SERL3|nr:uncharacterized protein SERLADRAFT_465273 [Serpula lacrymans var. lacrymans S7.9]EGN99743.1 hypothetical protein SERLA73DRAFT_179920 [Serpula lacrymans var. lacrymans S7.3]EGO25315.1 hypothetical protein SERLADRAFT_465273 [Serpula lacrymans var. lacrymans S7.9]